ncbi:uncharacterized protein LOC112052381 isoform X1 [Bicyclus anynana]|uniref:Uncharacterized protein LOC112052381 isoform X1 n=1 Tax=Bicyclus anynana TaxID=110368 RepID=A0ABM3M0G0_BICAN|nr:uncharacterized protein LOC112052381 isoform X1 [Bicyclus anynana]
MSEAGGRDAVYPAAASALERGRRRRTGLRLRHRTAPVTFAEIKVRACGRSRGRETVVLNGLNESRCRRWTRRRRARSALRARPASPRPTSAGAGPTCSTSGSARSSPRAAGAGRAARCCASRTRRRRARPPAPPERASDRLHRARRRSVVVSKLSSGVCLNLIVVDFIV